MNLSWSFFNYCTKLDVHQKSCGVYQWKTGCFCFLEIQVPTGELWSRRFNPVTFCVSVPCQDLDFQCHISWYFLFVCLCLNFLSVNVHDILINRKYFSFEIKTLKLHLLWFKMLFIYCYIYFYSNKIFVIYYI